MIRVEAGGTGRYCDGLTRRSFVQIGVAGMASVGLPHILAAKAAAKAKDPKAAKDTSVILIWLDGGPGHMDMYDMKPEAPAEYRGLWSPIRTNVRGMEITEMYPRQAKVADKFSIVRSLYHGSGDHFAAAHLMLTSRSGASGADQVGKYPGVGAYAIKSAGPRKPGMPAYVSVPYASTVGRRPGYMGGNYLGRQNDPFETAGDPNSKNFRVRNLSFANGLSIGRLENRKALLKSFDTTRREVDRSGAMDSMDAFEKQAYQMVVGPAARKAFDISREDSKTRDMYGRNSWGQSTLLARRLVEAGTTFVTVHMGGWDHHWNLQAGMENYLPRVDAAVSGLFTDLHRRGLDEKVLVVLCGEFSRTPKMNNGSGKGTPGRDHWGNSMFCLMGGGGVQGGRIVGSTDRLGQAPKDRPLKPADIHATIYHVLGVDPDVYFLNHAGRPVKGIDEGKPIAELL